MSIAVSGLAVTPTPWSYCFPLVQQASGAHYNYGTPGIEVAPDTYQQCVGVTTLDAHRAYGLGGLPMGQIGLGYSGNERTPGDPSTPPAWDPAKRDALVVTDPTPGYEHNLTLRYPGWRRAEYTDPIVVAGEPSCDHLFNPYDFGDFDQADCVRQLTAVGKKTAAETLQLYRDVEVPKNVAELVARQDENTGWKVYAGGALTSLGEDVTDFSRSVTGGVKGILSGAAEGVTGLVKGIGNWGIWILGAALVVGASVYASGRRKA